MRSITRGAAAVAVLVAALAETAVGRDDAARGKELYDTRCAFCHGSAGKGDGPAGAALQPRPTNFTEPAYWRSRDPSIVRMMIVNGKPGTAMVPFGQTLNDGEIDDVLAYLRTLR